MGATRRRRNKWRTSKFRRRPETSIKCLPASQPGTRDDNESAQVEPTDRLLLSSLRFWEVERDLIEERMSAMSR
jgi:hypothetical protein